MIDSSKSIILSAAYFPPIAYFVELINADHIFIEQFENYTKQSYRNRCDILSPNGIQKLSIPIKKISGQKQLIKNVKIDYKNDWQSLHVKSIQTAYLSSPFFEFYIDTFMQFFEKQYIYLFDLNLAITETILSELQIDKKIEITENYSSDFVGNDFRNSIHPKISVVDEKRSKIEKEYTQVFFDRFDFIPNLSILDLLFNEGPNSMSFLSR